MVSAYYQQAGRVVTSASEYLETAKHTLFEKCSFVAEFLQNPSVIGAIAPTSGTAANLMIRKIQEDTSGKKLRILEIGSGSGSVTKFIIQLDKEFELDAIECQPRMASIVRKMVDSAGKAAQVKIHEQKIQEFHSEHKYDYIVCTLPFNSFPPKVVSEILQQMENDLLEDNGKISSIEYIAIPTIRLIFQKIFCLYDSEPYNNFSAVQDAKKSFLVGKEVENDITYRNLPPARITHICKVKKD